MATDELAKLASAIGRRVVADGSHETAVRAVRLFRASAPTELAAVVYEPSLCIVVQGSKEVVLAGERYRYDPAQWLLVSVDLPVTSRVVEASPSRPCLVIRIALDSVIVGDLLAGGVTAPPLGPSARGLGVSPLEPTLLDAGEAAFRVGYESPSQFSREYRRMFGTPPRQDVEGFRVQTSAGHDARS